MLFEVENVLLHSFFTIIINMMLLLLARLMGKWLKNDEKWSSKANMVLLSLKSHFRFRIVPTDAAVNLVF